MDAPSCWLTLGGDASLRRALSHGGQQASWQPEGLVKSIAALEAEPTATSKRCGCALWGASSAR